MLVLDHFGGFPESLVEGCTSCFGLSSLERFRHPVTPRLNDRDFCFIDFAIDETVKYVQDRKAFGNRIMDFQNTRFKLAECKTKAELLRSFVNDCIARLEDGNLDAANASMAKWWGSQTQNEVMHECLQMHGGYGFMMEFPIARLYADSRVQMIYGGTNEIMKELIARSMDV